MALSETIRTDSGFRLAAHKSLATPIGRRAMLAWGARGALGLWTGAREQERLAVSSARFPGVIARPGTARDQLIFFSEEKELQFGLSAYREVLRQARLSENRGDQ